MLDPGHHTGHRIKRWNYPVDYRLPARMPGSVRRQIKAMEAEGKESPVPALARELEVRCRDFRRMDAMYAVCADGRDPAHTYWPEAYLGVIETADWLAFEAGGEAYRWARRIFESEMKRSTLGIPTDAGLSDELQELLPLLEDRLMRVARLTNNYGVLFDDLPEDRIVPELRADMKVAIDQAMENLRDAFEFIREAFARTPQDRLFKMRVTEIEYGPEPMIRLNAKTTMGMYGVRTIRDLQEVRAMQYNREKRMEPRRLEHAYWAWIYRKNRFQS